jgi:hypothetical protein
LKNMFYRTLAAVLASTTFASAASAHEMLPTYPRLSPSYVDDVMQVKMRMFNKRQDVEWYEIGVFDSKWQPVPFVTGYRILKVEYLSHVSFDVYIRRSDAKKATYICSQSKLRREKAEGTVIASRICSKFEAPRL